MYLYKELKRLRDRYKREKGNKLLEKKKLNELPNVLSLFSLCLSAGITVEQTLKIVSNYSPISFKELFRKVVNDLELGIDLPKSLFILNNDKYLRSLCYLLIESSETGSSCLQTLDLLHVDSINRIRRNAEKEIKKLPVLTLFPLVICILPSFVLLSVIPTIVDGFLKFN